jgi:hypothetical protein
MKPKNRCVHCGRLYIANPRVKNQKYCSRDICQRARKRRWQQRKMATDGDYRQNRKESRQMWQTRHPGYWQQYRERHPQYCERNRMLQKQRDAKRRAKHLAKMDALKQLKSIKPGTYYLIPCIGNLAKMDALTQKINVIPAAYGNFCASCKKGLDGPADTVAIQGSHNEEVLHDRQKSPLS